MKKRVTIWLTASGEKITAMYSHIVDHPEFLEFTTVDGGKFGSLHVRKDQLAAFFYSTEE